NLILTIALGVIFALWYFRDKKVTDNAREGLYLGLVLVVLGFILDVIVFAVQGQINNLLAYYTAPGFLVGLILFLITTTLVGWIKGHYVRRKSLQRRR